MAAVVVVVVMVVVVVVAVLVVAAVVVVVVMEVMVMVVVMVAAHMYWSNTHTLITVAAIYKEVSIQCRMEEYCSEIDGSVCGELTCCECFATIMGDVQLGYCSVHKNHLQEKKK